MSFLQHTRPCYTGKVPPRNRKHLAWIRSQPCVVGRDCWGRVEAAHVGHAAMAQKSSDFETIPLCRAHHRDGNDSYHGLGPRRFADVHNLDIPTLVKFFNARPSVKIEGGWYVAFLCDERYGEIGRVKDGLKPALKNLWQMCCERRMAS